MTLAFHGKSRRRQGGLVLLAIGALLLAVAAALIAYRNAQAAPVEIALTTIDEPAPGQFTASGTWSIQGNQCWVSGNRFHGYIIVFADPNGDGIIDTGEVPTVTFTDNSPTGIGMEDSLSGTGVLQYLIPAPCEGGLFDDSTPPGSNPTATNEPWPASGQGHTPSTFTLPPGTHRICAAVLHQTETGADADATSCYGQPVVVGGQITIKKIAASDPGQEFSFSVSPDLGSGPTTNPFLLQHDETETWSSQAGSYAVTEAEPGGWELMDITCWNHDAEPGVGDVDIQQANNYVTINLEDGDDILCVFTNREPPGEDEGTITIRKVAEGASESELFDFGISPDDDAIGPFSLGDGDSKTWNSQAGDYTITETDLPDGWAFVDIECTENGESAPVAGLTNGLVIALEEGDEWDCTFTNEPLPRVVIEKYVWDGDSWNLYTSGAPFSFDLTHGGGTYDDVVAGTYVVDPGSVSLIENDPTASGYREINTFFIAQGLSCPTDFTPTFDPNGVPSEVGTSVDFGETATACAYNMPFGTVVVEKIDLSANGQVWDFLVTGPGPDWTPQITGSGEESSQAGAGTYSASETTAGVFSSITQCPSPNPEGTGIYVSVSNPTGNVLDQPGEEIRFIFTNQDCPAVLATGNLRIEKWNDLDGDGVRDGGEPPIANWPVTVSGPEFPGGQAFLTNASGVVALDGIATGFYTVTEGSQGGWYQTGLVVDGVTQPLSATTIVEVAESSEEEPATTVVEFGNRELATVIVVKTVNDQVGVPPRGVGGWQINLAGCGTSINKVTDGTGTAVFSNLLPADNCAYTVTETDTEGFSVSYADGQVVAPGPGDDPTVRVHNSRTPVITFETPTPTPTATAVPTDTPTATPTEPAPTETVAGEKTPGAIATPIAPETGTGFRGSGAAGSLSLALLGLVAVTAGMMLVSLGRRE